MKRAISIFLAISLALSCAFIVPETESFAAAKAKYVKVKQATYEKMKKTISSQKKTISKQKKTIADKDATINKKKQTISWLWSSLEEFGYHYNYDTHNWEREVIPIDQINMNAANDVIPLLEQQTGLVIDVVETIDSWKTWYAFYVQADGDLYVITMKNKIVDVVTQLN